MTKYFMFQDEVSHKFWEISVNGNKQSISFGRVGSVGSVKEKVFPTDESCDLDSQKLIREKLKKGYLEIEKSIKISAEDNASPNEKISNYLKAQLDSYVGKLKVLPDLIPLVSNLFEKLGQFDFEAYKQRAEKEIEHNLAEWWTNPSKGINPEESVDSIYFEYGDYYRKGAHAESYGIVEWENFRPHTKGFDIGDNCGFAASFEAMPGITLDFFDPLEILDWTKLPDDLDEDELFYTEGYQEMLKAYLFSGLVALNEVFARLDGRGVFQKIKAKKGFMFLIGEHDMGEVFPVYTL